MGLAWKRSSGIPIAFNRAYGKTGHAQFFHRWAHRTWSDYISSDHRDAALVRVLTSSREVTPNDSKYAEPVAIHGHCVREIMPTKDKTTDAIAMLKEDHEKVKELFDKFETNGSAGKAKVVSEVLMKLKLHATVEEELFYPAVRQNIEDEEGIMDEADEEHHVAKVLIAELEKMRGDEDHWEAKFMVLAENVRHHIKEEEGKLFKEARKTDIDFDVLGRQMAHLKQKLMQEGVPPDAEAKMIAKCGLRGDSPARNAQKQLQVPLKRKAS